MIEAMCLYEVDLKEEPDPVYARADQFNGSVFADIGGDRRWIVYVQSDPPVTEDSPQAELLKQAIILFATRPQRPDSGALTPEGEEIPYRPRFHGVHMHDDVNPGVGCVDPSHHPSCQLRFGPAPETNCVKPGTQWVCTHED